MEGPWEFDSHIEARRACPTANGSRKGGVIRGLFPSRRPCTCCPAFRCRVSRSHQLARLHPVADEQHASGEFIPLGGLDGNDDLAQVAPDPDLVSLFEAHTLHVLRVDLQGSDFIEVLVRVLPFVQGGTLSTGASGDEDELFRHGSRDLKRAQQLPYASLSGSFSVTQGTAGRTAALPSDEPRSGE